MASATPLVEPAIAVPQPTKGKKPPYPFYLGGLAATIAASITHPLDLTKVRLQASGEKRMLESMRKTIRTAGVRGLFDGITGTWLRQMSYSLCRFWAYDESKKILGAGPDSPPWLLAGAGVMAGSIAGVVGNPGEVVMVRLQGDFAKPPEKRFNYKHCFDALFRVSSVDFLSYSFVATYAAAALPAAFVWAEWLQIGWIAYFPSYRNPAPAHAVASLEPWSPRVACDMLFISHLVGTHDTSDMVYQ